MANRLIMKLAKSVSRWAASVAIASELARVPPTGKTRGLGGEGHKT